MSAHPDSTIHVMTMLETDVLLCLEAETHHHLVALGLLIQGQLHDLRQGLRHQRPIRIATATANVTALLYVSVNRLDQAQHLIHGPILSCTPQQDLAIATATRVRHQLALPVMTTIHKTVPPLAL